MRVVTSSYQISGTDERRCRTRGTQATDTRPPPPHRHRPDPWEPPGRLYNLDVVRRQITDIARLGHVLDELQSWTW